MKNLTLRQLNIFAEVARQRNFTTAARNLNLSQPAVTMQIQQLEAAVGTPLLERIGRRISLTEAGERMLECSSRIGEVIEETRESIEAQRGLKVGSLKLCAVGSATYFSPSLLAQFTLRHPGITVRFVSAGTVEEALRQLQMNEIDFVIIGRSVGNLDMIAEPFARHPYVIVASPKHPLAGKRHIALKALGDERVFTRERETGTRSAIEEMLARQSVKLRSIQEMRSQETIKQTAMAGMGIGFLSMHAAGLELATGKLVTLDVKGFPVLSSWHLVRWREKRVSQTMAAFRDYVLEKGAATIEQVTGITKAATLRGRL